MIPAMLDLVDHLHDVGEVSDAIAQHLVTAVGAQAAVVLVPDWSLWVVAGSVGDQREFAALDADHWLVREVVAGGRGLVVTEDSATAGLGPVPLAGWRRLLAHPVQQAQALVLLARDDSQSDFTTADLEVAAAALEDGGAMLSAALQVRDLARRLARFG